MKETLKNKLSNGVQYRKMSFILSEEKPAEDENQVEGEKEPQAKKYLVEGYATTFNQPYELLKLENGMTLREQVDPKAFDECSLDDCIFQYDHEGRVFARTSNNTLTLEKDENGLKVIADLGGTEEGRKLYEEIKGGYTNKMSFGFIVDDEDVKEEEGGYLRTITKISRLFDVSAVSLPANDGTEISARNYGNTLLKEIVNKTNTTLELEKAKLSLLF